MSIYTLREHITHLNTYSIWSTWSLTPIYSTFFFFFLGATVWSGFGIPQDAIPFSPALRLIALSSNLHNFHVLSQVFRGLPSLLPCSHATASLATFPRSSSPHGVLGVGTSLQSIRLWVWFLFHNYFLMFWKWEVIKIWDCASRKLLFYINFNWWLMLALFIIKPKEV